MAYGRPFILIVSNVERDYKYQTAGRASLSVFIRRVTREENLASFFLIMFQSLEYITKERGVCGVFVCKNNRYFFSSLFLRTYMRTRIIFVGMVVANKILFQFV